MNIIMSEQIGSMAEALCKAQLAMKPVLRNKQGYGYKYAELSSCLEELRVLAENGIAVSQPINSEGDKHFLDTLLLHGSGQWIRSKFCIESVVMKQCNSLQQLGAGITYARKYALCATAGLTQEDDDAASITKAVPKNEPTPAPNELTIKANELVSLCNKYKIDVKEFAKFHSIDSKNIESVKGAIVNFPVLRDQFINKDKEVTDGIH